MLVRVHGEIIGPGKKSNKRNRNSSKSAVEKGIPVSVKDYRASTSENRAALSFVKGMKGPNHKYINGVYNSIVLAPTSAAPGLFLLNGVATGNTEITRVGRLTKNEWLNLDLSVYSTTAYDGALGIRIYVVVETTALGSALAPAQFFVDAAVFASWSQRDRTNRNASRYVVLWDSGSFPIGGLRDVTAAANTYATVSGTAPTEREFNIHIPLNFYTDYSRGVAGTIADIDTNSLYLLVVQDSANSWVAVNGAHTLCFSDDQ